MINIDDIVVRIACEAHRSSIQAGTIVDVVDMGAKPIVMPPAVKRRAMKAIVNAVKDTYYSEIPIQAIMNALGELGILVIQEDGTEWSGFITGASGRATFDLGYEGHPIKNAALQMTWYKMPSGRYEIVAYLA